MEKIIQGTYEWKKWRHGLITASDSPVIMGVSKFKTRLELYNEKILPDPPPDEDKYIYQIGHDAERYARAQYELETMLEWPPILCQWENNPKIAASLDGYNDSIHAIWECKYVGKEMYSRALDGEIPEIYYPQLMHQSLVTGAKTIHFTAVNSDYEMHTIIKEINDSDISYIKNELLPSIERFIYAIDNKIPPDLSDNDSVNVDDELLESDLSEYFKYKKAEKSAKIESDKIKKTILVKAKKIHNNILCGNYKIKNNRITEIKK